MDQQDYYVPAHENPDDRRMLLEALGQEFSAEDTSTRRGAGGKEFTYIAGEAVIRHLNAVTDGRWSSRLVGQPMTQELMTKNGVRPCLIAYVEVTVPDLDATHVGMGVQVIEPEAGEDVLKGAITDAVKNAAKYLGVGLYLYGGHAPQQARTYVDQSTGEIRQGSGFTANSRTANDAATPKQVDLVRKLIGQIGMTPAEARAELGVDRAEDLTKYQASQAIERLMARAPQPSR